MLVAAAFCPCPPILHPAVSVGAAFELDELRAACVDAVRAVTVDAAPDVVVAVGPDTRSEAYPVGARGSLAPFGVDLVLGRGDGEVVLPPSLTLAAWLCDEAGTDVPVEPVGVAGSIEPAQAMLAGVTLTERPERIALVVMGEGSARRSEKAPGGWDERAEPYDRAVTDAIAAVDLATLGRLDAAEATDLMASGRAPWQVATGAATGGEPGRLTGRLVHEDARYGVGYLVATWLSA